MIFVKHPFRLLLPLLLALAQGCDAARLETSVRAEQRGVQVTGDPAFFCDWSDEVSAFNKAAADYALGNRRTLDAWAVLNTQVVPGTMEDRLDTCWRGALYYLGSFGTRAELGPLVRLAAHDPVLASETSDADSLEGISNVGELRALGHRFVYFALAIQVRRQIVFDGALDDQGKAAQGMIEACASSVDRCMDGTAMHPYRRRRLQRNAVRALAISGWASGLAVLEGVRSGQAAVDSLMVYALGDADRLRESIGGKLGQFKAAIPAP